MTALLLSPEIPVEVAIELLATVLLENWHFQKVVRLFQQLYLSEFK